MENIRLGEGFWGKDKPLSEVRRLPADKEFTWAGYQWRIPAVYLCPEGIVMDLCRRILVEQFESFLDQWQERVEEGNLSSWEEEEVIFKNPLHHDFSCRLTLGGKELKTRNRSSVSWVPERIQGRMGEKEEASWMDEYALSRKDCWTCSRISFAWEEEKPDRIREKEFSLTLMPEDVKLSCKESLRLKAGEALPDAVDFIHPLSKEKWRIQIRNVREEKLSPECFDGKEGFEYPCWYQLVEYGTDREGTNQRCRLLDSSRGDSPRYKGKEAGAMGVSVLGAEKCEEGVWSAVSSLYFEPGMEVVWRLCFYEKMEEPRQVTWKIL